MDGQVTFRPVVEEKAGFTREGVLRGASFRQGRYRDDVIYSVLHDEVNLEDSAAEDGTV
jgi:RimJ/RimL family protein N-acetyltransferase